MRHAPERPEESLDDTAALEGLAFHKLIILHSGQKLTSSLANE
jgi:hypothetical protein